MNMAMKYGLPTSMFQSHLYGIESDALRRQVGIQIGFQSHLYGIESDVGAARQRERHRFNRTFMELKVRYPLMVRFSILSFNRTFMELKV